MGVRIYHNPKCSKSRETLKILQDQGVEPEVIEYLKEPPEPHELSDLLKMMGLTPRQIMRAKEGKEAGLDDPSLSDDQVLEGLSKNPRAIERPIVTNGNKAVIGRPPENVRGIL